MTAFPFASHSRQRSFRSRSSTGVYRLVGSGRTSQNRRYRLGRTNHADLTRHLFYPTGQGGHSSSINPQPIGASPRSDAPAATDCLANHRRRLEHGTEARCSQDIDVLRAMTMARKRREDPAPRVRLPRLGGKPAGSRFGGNLERARGSVYVGTYVERVNRPTMLTGGFLGEVLWWSRNTL
jgi:hypothetical protein